MSTRRILNPIALALFALSITAGTAGATTLPGNAGRAYWGSDVTCFSQPTWAGITSTCTGTRPWVIAIPNTATANPSSLTIKANGVSCGPGGCPIGTSYPTCKAFKVPQGGAGAVGGTAVSVDGPNKTLFTFSNNVLPTDTFHVVCEFSNPLQGPGAVKPLLSVSW
jgi:hypothetical protein